jgi:hypothetical protein
VVWARLGISHTEITVILHYAESSHNATLSAEHSESTFSAGATNNERSSKTMKKSLSGLYCVEHDSSISHGQTLGSFGFYITE